MAKTTKIKTLSTKMGADGKSVRLGIPQTVWSSKDSGLTKPKTLRFRKSLAPTKSASVVEKRIQNAKGNTVVVRTLDANSADFGNDLHYTFFKNVTAARRANSAIKFSAGADEKKATKGAPKFRFLSFKLK